MFCVKCCNGYYIVGRTNDPKEAERIARNHVDGTFACIITDSRGRIVGDCVEGFTGERKEEVTPYQRQLAQLADRFG